MTEPVKVPQVRARTGQLSVAPDVGDAVTGLLQLVLPLLGLVAYVAGSPTTPSGVIVLVFLLVYSVGSVIAVRGFLSDLTPWRVAARFIPVRVVAAGLAYSVFFALGAIFTALPDSRAAKAAVTERIAEFESSAASAASSASSAGDPTPAQTPVPGPTLWDNFLATGVQHTIGRVLLAIALVALGALIAFYVLARIEQLRRFPRVRPFDIPDHELGDSSASPGHLPD